MTTPQYSLQPKQLLKPVSKPSILQPILDREPAITTYLEDISQEELDDVVKFMQGVEKELWDADKKFGSMIVGRLTTALVEIGIGKDGGEE